MSFRNIGRLSCASSIFVLKVRRKGQQEQQLIQKCMFLHVKLRKQDRPEEKGKFLFLKREQSIDTVTKNKFSEERVTLMFLHMLPTIS
jgi:hypothetical protein